MTRSRLVKIVGLVGFVAVVAALCAVAADREFKVIEGTVVSVDLENLRLTVKADATGQVVVLVPGWQRGAGRNPEHLEVLRSLKPGDKIEAKYFYAEELWIIETIRKEAAAQGGDLQQLQAQVTAMQGQLTTMEKKLDTIEGLLKQLLAK